MNKLLKFLIYNLKTFDGQRDSAVGLINALNKQDIYQYQVDNETGCKSTHVLKSQPVPPWKLEQIN